MDRAEEISLNWSIVNWIWSSVCTVLAFSVFSVFRSWGNFVRVSGRAFGPILLSNMSYLVGEQVHDDHSAVGLGVGLNIMLRLGTMMKTDTGMVLNTMMRL